MNIVANTLAKIFAFIHNPMDYIPADRFDRTYSNNLCHLVWFNSSISVDVVHMKRPFELLFRFTRRRDVDGEQELFEVYLAAVVRVERPEDVFTELVGVALREEAGVDVEELVSGQLTVGTISLKLRNM